MEGLLWLDQKEARMQCVPRKHKFFIHCQGAALVTADQFALLCLVRVLGVICSAFHAGRNRLAFVFVQRNQACCSQFYHLPAKRKCRTMAA